MIRSFLIFCFLLFRMNTSRPQMRTFYHYFHFENCFAYSTDILTPKMANYTKVFCYKNMYRPVLSPRPGGGKFSLFFFIGTGFILF